jgi:hypothetical protein
MNECYSNIRNKPEKLYRAINKLLYGEDYSSPVSQKSTKSNSPVSQKSTKSNSPVFENVYKKLKETKEIWECSTCMTQNEISLTKCKACEEPRQ